MRGDEAVEVRVVAVDAGRAGSIGDSSRAALARILRNVERNGVTTHRFGLRPRPQIRIGWPAPAIARTADRVRCRLALHPFDAAAALFGPPQRVAHSH